jgi:thiosulfate/3-mercaptopyruvate sulfurtransferase
MSTLNVPGHIVSPQWLFQHINHPDVIILDGSMAAPGHPAITQIAVQIGDAQFFDINRICDQDSELPHMMPEADQFTEQVQQLGINQESVVVIYDGKGIFSSARVWWMFKAMGLEQVAVLDGGVPAWQAAGLPVSHSAQANAERPRGDFVATHLEGYFCDVNRVLSGLADPRINVLDARSDSRFCGVEKDPRPGVRSGHMPGALNLHYAKLFESEGERVGLLKSKADLAMLFDKISPNHSSLIFSCGSGVTACILALAATIVGYTEISVYDGSWSEWGSMTECPVVFT